MSDEGKLAGGEGGGRRMREKGRGREGRHYGPEGDMRGDCRAPGELKC